MNINEIYWLSVFIRVCKMSILKKMKKNKINFVWMIVEKNLNLFLFCEYVRNNKSIIKVVLIWYF